MFWLSIDFKNTAQVSAPHRASPSLEAIRSQSSIELLFCRVYPVTGDLYSREPQQVESLLSTLINPRDSVNRLDVDKCLWVICGGQKPEDFTRIIKANDRSVICGLVWDANFIAYRCKTCGIAPCMSLCADCFENGEHEGHDFNMFKSGAGGACDCGNHEVMKQQGFCSRHGPKAAKNTKSVSEDVTLMVRLVVPKLINFLICKMEHAIAENHGKVDKTDEEAAKLLLQLCEMGDVTRKIVAEAMLRPVEPEYRSRSKSDVTPYLRRQSSSDSPDLQGLGDQRVTDSILSSLPGPSKDLSFDIATLDSRTVMEKMIDLLIELKFSQFLVTLMLSMLQEAVYKQEFMKAFCMRYSKIANLLTHRFEGDEDQRLCNRLVHASVQLFSNEQLTMNMVENNNLLSIVVSALSDLISRTLTKVDWDSEEDSVNSKSLFVVNCDHEIIRHHRYWPVVSDFHNLLSHDKIARYFLGEAALIRRWMGILTHFTGMNKNKRQLIVHVAYENLTSQHAYSAEIETSSHIMTNLLCVCTSPAESDQIRLVLSECVRALRSWFRMIQVQIVKPFLVPLNGEEFTATGPIPRQEITFHLPLHRYLAGFISQAINYCGMSLEEVLPSEDILWCVMEHVLRIQIGIGEILSGLWVRNGYMLRSQEEFYLQGQYCNQCVDLDIFLLQVCVMGLDSDHFMTTLLQRYGLETWFKFGELVSPKQPEDTEIQQGLVESMLNLLLQLVYQRMYMGLSEESMVHLELVTKLTMGDFTHSQLTDHLPEKPGMSELTELFDEVLSKVSDYKQPTNDSGSLTQGIYALKPDLWKSDFQPLHVMLRGSYKRGYQLAMDKYKGWYQSRIKKKVQGLWPPFRAPLELNTQFKTLYRLLRSKTLHAVLFTVLYKALNEKDSVNDNMVYLTFYLVDLAIDTQKEDIVTPVLDQGLTKPDITVAELEDGNVPQAIIKCIKFLEQSRAFAVVDPFKEKASDPKVTELCRKLISSPYAFVITGNQYSIQDVSSALLLLCNHRLQPPLFGWLLSAAKQLNQGPGSGQTTIGKKSDVHHYQQILEQLPPHRYKMIEMLVRYLNTLVEEEVASYSDVCNVYLPYNPAAFATIVSYYDWVFRVRRPTEEGYSPTSVFDIKYKSDNIAKNANQSVIGTSLIKCMYDIRKRLSVVDCTVSPSVSNTSTSHNGVEAITAIFDKLCSLDPNNSKLLRSLERADASTPDRGSSPCSSSEAKRKRAKERQEKLLQAFASKQRIFEAQMEDDLLEGEEETAPAEEAKVFSCIICGMDSAHSEDKPIATLVFCQPTSIHLHSTQPGVERAVMDSGLDELPTFHSTVTDHYRALSDLYPASKAWYGVGQRSQPGLHVQSCGHTVHVQCFRAYQDSQPEGPPDLPEIRISLGIAWGKELNCPTCRRLSNSILPLPCTPYFIPYTKTEVIVPVSPATQIPLPFVHTCTDKLFSPSHPLSCLGCETLKLSTKVAQLLKTGKVDAVKGAIAKATPTPWEVAVEGFVWSLEVVVPVSPATQIPLPFVHTCTDKLFSPSHPLSCLGCETLKLSTKVAQLLKTGKVDAVKGAIAKATPTPWEVAVEGFVWSLEFIGFVVNGNEIVLAVCLNGTMVVYLPLDIVLLTALYHSEAVSIDAKLYSRTPI
eukprot:sb/3460767/